MDLNKINTEFKSKRPSAIIQWALAFAKAPIITTNFRPYEVAILHAVSKVEPNIKVIWCDTGYNTPNTYKHARELIDRFKLNIHLYVPKQSAAYRDVVMGIPSVDSPELKMFTEQVKLEPFSRAMAEHQPDVWFTNLRMGQTKLRDGLDIVSKDKRGIIKVSPFYHFSDSQLDSYLEEHVLPNEFKYYDPTKQLANRECGLHT